jgi:Flp pilus assembly CpaE family ATPase
MHLQVPSVRNADRLVHRLLQQGLNGDRLQLICNRGDRDNSGLEREHVESTLGRKIFCCLPDEWNVVSNAINVGEPLAGCAPRSRIRQAIQELAQRLARPEEDATAVKPKKAGGLFAKIFSEG